jgi:hypothetical protein
LGGWEGGDWGVSGGEASGPSWRGRIRGVEREGRGGGDRKGLFSYLITHTLGRLSNLTTLF